MPWSGYEIKTIRLKLGWSQADFGRRLGLTRQQVEDLELGRLPVDPELDQTLYFLNQGIKKLRSTVRAQPLQEQRQQTQAVSYDSLEPEDNLWEQQQQVQNSFSKNKY